MELNILRADPAGNITVFVLDPVEKAQRAAIAEKIMAIPALKAEQVGYACTAEDDVDGHMEMMGGEFCGNALRCAGFNNVDTKACFGKLHVFRVPAYSPYAVAEHAMALLLTVNRHTNKAYIRTRDFNFSLSGLTGFDLHGKTVGVIGTGKIGRIFAEICKGFGMRVLAYDKFPNLTSGLDYVELPELLRQADVISLHCPLTDETRHMIDADAIAQMKPGVVLVNTSRGGLVDTEALIEGLKSHKVGAACLDVYEEEGDLFYEDCSEEIVADDTLVRLISMPNVIVTSHQAFLTKEALSNIAATTVDNLLKFERGEPSPDTEVCYHCERKETCRKARDQKCF